MYMCSAVCTILTLTWHISSLSKGIYSATVALLAEKADISYDPNVTDPDKISSAILGLGYNAQLLSQGEGLESGTVDLEVQMHLKILLVFVKEISC